MTPWTVAHQAPLSMGILQGRILEWVACTPPGDLPNPGIEPQAPALQTLYHRNHQKSLENSPGDSLSKNSEELFEEMREEPEYKFFAEKNM